MAHSHLALAGLERSLTPILIFTGLQSKVYQYFDRSFSGDVSVIGKVECVQRVHQGPNAPLAIYLSAGNDDVASLLTHTMQLVALEEILISERLDAKINKRPFDVLRQWTADRLVRSAYTNGVCETEKATHVVVEYSPVDCDSTIIDLNPGDKVEFVCSLFRRDCYEAGIEMKYYTLLANRVFKL